MESSLHKIWKLNVSIAVKYLFLMLISTLLIFPGCKTKENPAPEALFPTMTSIAISGEKTTFDVTVGFSEGVYGTSLQSGDLNEDSFNVTSSNGVATLVNYVVTHSAGQKNCKIRVVFNKETNGSEQITISPRNAKSIYNYQGRAMDADQWRAISTSGIEHQIITVKDTGEGTGTKTWTSNNDYLLDGFVFVNEGQTLTIEPGTIIKGKAGQGVNASALIVARGARIFAEGTAEQPIIFTSEDDNLNGSVLDLENGLWGGVIILGRATMNASSGEGHIEGIPSTEQRGIYGGNDDSDDSGIFKYVSIRHGGTDIGDGNEINGLTLGAVGSKTVIEFVEVFSNNDDGVEIFGGAAQLKNILVAFCGDDSFDYDLGYHGKGQFWLAVQGFGLGDKLGEHDGGYNDADNQPYSAPEIFNATYTGLEQGYGKRVISFRTNSGGHYTNSIFYHQAYGIDLELEKTLCSFDRFQSGDLTLENNIFYGISFYPLIGVMAGEGLTEQEINDADSELSNYFTIAGNTISDPGFTLDGLTFKLIPTKDVSENMGDYPNDGWFEQADYKGAFKPGENWAAGWTLFSKYMN